MAPPRIFGTGSFSVHINKTFMLPSPFAYFLLRNLVELLFLMSLGFRTFAAVKGLRACLDCLGSRFFVIFVIFVLVIVVILCLSRFVFVFTLRMIFVVV